MTPIRARHAVNEALGDYFNAPRSPDRDGRYRPKILVYLLDHEYTPKGISWEILKNNDALRASALLETADSLGLEAHLALADVQEVWNCEMDERGWSYGVRGGFGDGFDDDYDNDEVEDEDDFAE